MDIYVVSDTHGHIDSFIGKVEEIGRPDKIFFLGDYAEDALEIERILGIEVIGVRGNNDFLDQNYRDEEVFNLEGFRIFLTHGHQYGVNFDISNLYYRGKELGADLIFFGHTHRPTQVEEEGIKILNPGSPSFPRTRKREKTFIKLSLKNGLEYKFIKIG